LAHEFVETLNDAALAQNVSEPTFINAGGDLTSTLDLVLTETPGRAREILSGPPLGSAMQGHLTLRFEIALASIPSAAVSLSRKRYAVSRGDYQRMRDHLGLINWSEILGKKSTEEAYEAFLAVYREACDLFIPICQNRLKGLRRPKWSTKEIALASKKKKRLWHSNVRTGWRCATLIKEYKCARNSLKKLVKEAVRNHELDLAQDKKNSKRLYAYVNSKRTINDGISAIKNESGETVTDRHLVAEALNRQFSSVFVEEKLPVGPSLVESELPLGRTDSVSIDVQGVMAKLRRLNKQKSTGGDGVTPYVLNECAEVLAIPLCIIFKKSLTEGVVPSYWRSANVTPLFKKGSRLDPGNYRPVSITSVPCKILECFIKDEIVKHLLGNRLICPEQHGFVPRKACVTNLLETVDLTTKNMANGIPTDIVFLDFAKASRINVFCLSSKVWELEVQSSTGLGRS